MNSRLIKICGLSSEPTLEAALEAGAGMVGFVFFPRSPRHLGLDQARALADVARGRAEIVALSVDADDDTLLAIYETVAPDWLQLHGGETPDRVRDIKTRFGRPVMKAIGVSSRADLAAAQAYRSVADRFLFDAKPPRGADLPGGNGQVFDWTILTGLDLPAPFMLSGGLTDRNVGEAIRITGAPGVDVSSGVETAPGRKDAGLIRAVAEAARGGPV